VNGFERIGEAANAPLPDIAGSGGFAATFEEFPIARGRSIRDGAGQLDASASESGLEVIESPFIIGEQAKLRLNVLHSELTSRLVGFGDRPGEAASAKAKRINLKLKFGQSLVIELELHLRESEFGAQGIISAVEPHVFGDDSLVPSHTQSGELKIDSALM